MATIQKVCAQNKEHTFTVTDSDLSFYDKMSPVFGGKKLSIPTPTLCPECRQQRRLAHGNQMHLYERKCDLTGSSIISNFAANSPYKVYRQEDWYSDKWDPLQYGRAYDFSRPFFEQFQELSLVVPRPALHRGFAYDDNADYTNYAGKNKNCYLIFDSDHNRDCYYSYSVNNCESCMDCYRMRKSELCYGCIDCEECYNSAFLQDCSHCSDSMFLQNCVGCKNCLFSSNLVNKEYYVENKKVSKEEFARIRKMLTSHTAVTRARRTFEKFRLKFPYKFMHGLQNDHVVGDYMTNSKNSEWCFDSMDLWDCKYVFQAFDPLKDTMDTQECGDGERLYESAFSGYSVYNLIACVHCLGEVSDMYYCMHSPHSKNLFGCVGVMHRQYCILNKQYTKEEYEQLVPKIIERMQSTGEWGEFFPIALSLFPYDTTLAQDYYPMSQESILQAGWQWQGDTDSKSQYMGVKKIPVDAIADANDSVCDEIFTCESSGKYFKIIKQELKLLQQMQLPLPRKSFFERHKERLQSRNPRMLWDRTCMKCSAPIKTSYAPERKEIIYCEECYRDSVHA